MYAEYRNNQLISSRVLITVRYHARSIHQFENCAEGNPEIDLCKCVRKLETTYQGAYFEVDSL